MTKRTLALILAALMIVTLFAGCNSGNPVATDPSADPSATGSDVADYGDVGGLVLPLTDERVDITWMTAHDNIEWADSPLVQEVFKRTGVYINILNVPADASEEKINTMLASGNIPNICVGGNNLDIYGEQGAYVDLTTQEENMPNMFGILRQEENEWYLKSKSSDTGALYELPKYDLNRDVNHMWMYRKDIFDKNNLTVWEPGDTVGFYETLKTLKEIYPESYPFSAKTGNDIWRVNAAGWDINGGQFPFTYNEDTGLWEYGFFLPEMKEILDWYKTFYNEGLLDPEFLTNTAADWTAKFAAPEKSFVTWDWISRTNLLEQQVAAEQPEYDLEGAAPWGPTGKTYTLPRLSESGMAISAVTENWEIACKLVDYFYSPSGAELETIGIEGEWFNYDENGVPVYTDPELTGVVDINTLGEKYGMWNSGMYLRTDRRSHYHILTENEQGCVDVILNGNGFTETDPSVVLTNEENEIYVDLNTDLVDQSFIFCMKYVMENGTDADWDKWVNESAKLYEVDNLLAVYNAAQARYDAK